MTEKFEVDFLHETTDAVLIWNGDAEIWLPKSQIKGFEEDTYSKWDGISIEIPIWLAEEKEMV